MDGIGQEGNLGMSYSDVVAVDAPEFSDLARTFSNSCFLVTGASGMIGQNVIALLLRLNDEHGAGIHVLAHVRDGQKAQRVFACYGNRGDLELCVSDICELSSLPHFDWAVHGAGVTGGSKKHVDNPLRTINTALDGTKAVLEAACANEVRGVVFLSTLEVYGTMPSDTASIREDDGGYVDPMRVRSSYPESKRMCECLCAAYASQRGLPVYVARLGITFGPGVAYSDGRVFAQFARSVINRQDIVLKTLGETVRSYCDAADAASALLTILAKGEPGQAYNVTNGEAVVSIKEFAELFVESFPESGIQLRFELADDVERLGYRNTVRSVLNAEKLESLGWRPQYALEKTVRRLVAGMEETMANEESAAGERAGV